MLCKPLNTGKADARIRTGDPFITSEVLYQLSYVGNPAILKRIVAGTSGHLRDVLPV